MISQAALDSGTRTGRAGAFGGFGMRWALLLSAGGGLALFASFPPVGAWPLAAAGPGMLAVALTGRSLRGSLGCGLAFGVALFVPLLSWLVNVAWYAWAALALSEAVIFAILCLGQRLLLELPCWPAAVAAWWVAAEALRDRWPFAFPWGRLAMSQSVAPDVRWVAIGGAPLLSFLVALTGAMAARAVLGALGAGGWRSRASAGAALAAVVTAGLVLAGGLLPVDPVGGAPTAPVAAIQGDVPRARNLPQQLNDTEVTQNQAADTLKLAAEVKAGQLAAPDLVVWPENATGVDPRENPAFTLPSRARWPRSAGRSWSARSWTTRGATSASCGCPASGRRTRCTSSASWSRSASTSRSAASSPASARCPRCSRWTSRPVIRPWSSRSADIRLGDVICYEVGFDNLVRSEVNAGANLLAVQSNDADFEIDGQLGETEQETAMARIRAVESDRAVVYASITGESSIIAPDGALMARSGVWRQAILDERVPLVSYRTLADRVGAWPEYVLVLAAVAALGWAIALRLRRRGSVSST